MAIPDAIREIYFTALRGQRPSEAIDEVISVVEILVDTLREQMHGDPPELVELEGFLDGLKQIRKS